jgi:hypothetical protein
MVRNAGAEEMFETANGEGFYPVAQGDDPDGMIQNVRSEYLEGVQRSMQNKRELGSHPIGAFNWVVPNNAPDSVVSDIAASEKCIFESGMGERSEEVQEYLSFLEEKVIN